MQVTRMLSMMLVPAGLAVLASCGGGREQAQDTEAAAAAAAERYRAVLVPEGLTWEEAKARAEADGGHLVTITSAEENAQVYGLIADNAGFWANVDGTATVNGEEVPIQVSIGPWIGLYQPPGAEEPAGGWAWVTGEPVAYTNWLTEPADAAEPNDLGGVENYGAYFARGLDAMADTWNDMPNDPRVDFAQAGLDFVGEMNVPHGYIVEFE